MKTCRKCGVLFDGLRCRNCANIYQAKYAVEHSEQVKARDAKRWKEHPDKKRAAYIKWRVAHPEIARIKSAEWMRNHPETRRKNEHNRRARKKGVGGVLSIGLAAKLLKLQKGKCPCCGNPLGDDYHLDHRMPLALGGANEDGNMQLLRKQCNFQKAARNPVEFMQLRGFLV